MKDFIIQLSEAEDVYDLKDNLRTEDVQECQAGGQTPFQALLNGFVHSDECYSAKINNRAVAMFGISTKGQAEGVGVIWFLGGDETEKHPISMVKDSKEYIDRWLEKYKMLWNIVDARNTRHIAWLKHLGFKFLDPIKVNGYEFLQFYKNGKRD